METLPTTKPGEDRRGLAVQILRREFRGRTQRNPRYSLRAFARCLGISHTALSMVFSGKRSTSKGLLHKIRENCALSPREIKLLDSAPSTARYTDVGQETFEVIADWRHYAVLSLLPLAPPRSPERWIAQRLRVTPLEARELLKDLKSAGVLVEAPAGTWRQSPGQITYSNTISTKATREFNRGLLRKAEETMDTLRFDERELSSIIFALDERDLPDAYDRIRKFRRELCEAMEIRATKANRVYALCVQLFPLSEGGSYSDNEKEKKS